MASTTEIQTHPHAAGSIENIKTSVATVTTSEVSASPQSPTSAEKELPATKPTSINAAKVDIDSSYKYASPLISERALDQPRPLKVVYIGAGISGILAAIKFRQTVPDIDLVIYEKNPELGGTWYENKYPGCACGKIKSLLYLLACN